MENPTRRWWLPAVPPLVLGVAFGAAYLRSLPFARDVRLLGNALRSDEVQTLRTVLHGFGAWEPGWAYLAVVMRMFTVPWSLGPLTEALTGRLGPAAGWTVIVLGVTTGLLAFAALAFAIAGGLRAALRRRA